MARCHMLSHLGCRDFTIGEHTRCLPLLLANHILNVLHGLFYASNYRYFWILWSLNGQLSRQYNLRSSVCTSSRCFHTAQIPSIPEQPRSPKLLMSCCCSTSLDSSLSHYRTQHLRFIDEMSSSLHKLSFCRCPMAERHVHSQSSLIPS